MTAAEEMTALIRRTAEEASLLGEAICERDIQPQMKRPERQAAVPTPSIPVHRAIPHEPSSSLSRACRQPVKVPPDMLDLRTNTSLSHEGATGMVAQSSTVSQHADRDVFLTEEEELAVMENLARTHFDMSLDESAAAWRAGRFDDDQERHNKVVGLAMMLPEYWND